MGVVSSIDFCFGQTWPTQPRLILLVANPSLKRLLHALVYITN
jgi:hypothetical protein